jgi:hypothetical protein
MIRAFMIEYDYEGKSYFANVVERKDSPKIFHVSPVDTEYNISQPKLTLRHEGEKIVASEQSSDTDRRLIDTIASKILDYLHTGSSS